MSRTAIIVWLLFVTQARSETPAERPQPRVPEGFTVEQSAGPDQTQFPMFAAFDDRGRLFVAESSGLDLYAELVAQTRKCRIRLLEDRDRDGRFETSIIFADKLVFPMGVAWRNKKLYVADPPDLITLEDTDGDDRADRRTVILTGFGHIDNGSLHGLIFGPDGLLYMTMGSPDGYRLRRADGSLLTGQTGALIRCRPDGSHPEVVARGFENLVEIAFTADGQIVGTDNWFMQPRAGLRDALVHIVDGGLYPYRPDVGTPQPITGPPLGAVSLFPAVALSGIVRYEGNAFPAEMRGNLFSAQHNARKVGRHVLVPEGATFKSREEDFLACEHPDFHPSDVLEDSDGSLLVIDTGGWYVQHCPTGRIRNSLAPGGIYRVRATGSHKKSESAREKALWKLQATDDASAKAPLRAALSDPDWQMRGLAARVVAHRDDRGAAGRLAEMFVDESPHVRRAAAEALARCGDRSHIEAISSALAKETDTFLVHALVHAIYRLASKDDLEKMARSPSPLLKRPALLLLDQPPHNATSLTDVLAALGSDDGNLRATAVFVLKRHPDWATRLAPALRELLSNQKLAAEGDVAAAELITAFVHEPSVAEIVASILLDQSIASARRVALLDAVSRSTMQKPPSVLRRAFQTLLADANRDVLAAAVRLASTWPAGSTDATLAAIAKNSANSAELRLDALRAVSLRQPAAAAECSDVLAENLSPDVAGPLRLTAAEILGRAELNDRQLASVIQSIDADPLVSPHILLGTFTRSITPATASRVVDYLEAAMKRGWRPDPLHLPPLAQRLHALDAKQAARLESFVAQTAADQHAKLAEFQSLATGGSADRGRGVFFSKKATCSACHALAGQGKAIGPDLSRIGAVRSARDLVESIVVPGSTFAQGFENYNVRTSDGETLTGIIARQSATVLTLRDSSGAERRIPTDSIETMQRAATSLMPDGLARNLSTDEFRDLVAYLTNLK